MAKLLKISGRTLGLLVEWSLIFIIIFAFAIRTSPVQTYLAQEAAAYFSKEFGTTVAIEKVDIVFFDEVALDGVLLEDLDSDTLIAVNTLYATITDWDLDKNEFTIGTFDLDQPYGHTKKDSAGTLNIQFLKDYFKSESTGEKKTIKFDISSVSIHDGTFKYDDFRKEPSETGMDFARLAVTEINGEFEDLAIVDDHISAKIVSLSAKEKSGFVLEKMVANADVSPAGVYIDNLAIKSSRSTIIAPKLNMISKTYNSFNYFEDSVVFDAKLSTSRVSLEDVALFGHPLHGMDEVVTISSTVSKTVNDLKLTDFDLKIRSKTHLKGTINLPDFKDIESALFHEKLDYAYVDLDEISKVKLPERSTDEYIKLDDRLKRLQFFEAHDVRLDGFYSQFVLASDLITTQLGSVRMNNGMMFTENPVKNSFFFMQSSASDFDVKVEQFQLGKFMADSRLGVVDGIFFLSGEAFATDDIRFTSIEGNLNRFDFMDYAYKNISIQEGTYANDVFEARIDIKDDNLDLSYDGFIDLKGDQRMKFSIDLTKAVLSKLGFSNDNINIASSFDVDLIGSDPNKLAGDIVMNGFVYTEDGKDYSVPGLSVHVERGEVDVFQVNSTMGTVNVTGKMDLNHLYDDLNYQLSRVFPALFNEKVDPARLHVKDHFDYDVSIVDIDELLRIFAPGTSVAHGTKLSGHYYGEQSSFVFRAKSDSIRYKKFLLTGLDVHQVLDSNNLSANYHCDRLNYNDTLDFNDLYFTSRGGKNLLNSEFLWDQGTPNASQIHWDTRIHDLTHFDFILEPSYFSIEEKRWEIANQSNISVNGDTIDVNDFKLRRDKQLLSLYGRISNLDKHRLNFEVNNFELEELTAYFTDDISVAGTLDGWGYVSNPVNNLAYVADARVQNLALNGESVGNVFVQSTWDKRSESIKMSGDLTYRDIKTFNFKGNYFTKREKDNLSFNLFFDNTDLSFTNAFMDPDVVSDIRGFLNGSLKLQGTPNDPVLDGKVALQSGSANVEILGAYFGIQGDIEVDKYGFYMNSIPVFDEEGNAGSLIGSVLHDHFRDFNFDLQFDLERDGINRDPDEPWRILPLDRFLVMNSEYSPDETYYGKAYVTGTANIFGYTDNLEITVDLQSQKGTKINFPMYGTGEIDEETGFIDFINSDSAIVTDPKFDFTGVELDLHLDVTKDAEMKIIFNEALGDVITAKGSGDMRIEVDNLNHIGLDGVFTIDEGVYDFAMEFIRQKFFIERGGTIAWSGNPYDANLNLRTYHLVNANIGELSPDQFANSSGAHQEIYCYLDLGETLLKPTIGFDIEAPNANDAGKALINSIKGDDNEMNRQFFSLLLWKRFQPMAGQATASGGAALDLVANQINSLLSKVSSDYKLNVGLDNDALTGDNTLEFGLKKSFLDDRLIFTGSFGVENQNHDGTDESSLIGDLNLEYLLNESGTFRVNIFNESNDRTIVQDENKGDFTQGVGLNYQEEFNTAKDFKMIQYFFDIFRKKENKRYPIKRKRRQKPVPPKQEEPATSPLVEAPTED